MFLKDPSVYFFVRTFSFLLYLKYLFLHLPLLCALGKSRRPFGPQFPYLQKQWRWLPVTAYTHWFNRAVKYLTPWLPAVSLLFSASQDTAPINHLPSLLAPCSSIRAQSPPSPLHSSPVQHKPYPDLAALLCYNLLSPFLFTTEQMPPKGINTVPTSPKSLLFLANFANLLLSQSQSFPFPPLHRIPSWKITRTNYSVQFPVLLTPSSGFEPQPPTEGKDNVIDKRVGSTLSSVINCFVWSWKRHVISLDLSFRAGFIDSLRAF